MPPVQWAIVSDSHLREMMESGLPAPLRDYQWQGVSFLLGQDGALLADDMGLGKTVQVAVALSSLLPRARYGRALVIAPASLRLNWVSELRRWAPRLSVRSLQGDSAERRALYQLPIHILVASY